MPGGGDPTLDEMIGNIMLYWLPGTAASSGRLYWERFGDFAANPVTIPVAAPRFPKRYSAPRAAGDLIFACFERPAEAAFRADCRCGMAGF